MPPSYFWSHTPRETLELMRALAERDRRTAKLRAWWVAKAVADTFSKRGLPSLDTFMFGDRAARLTGADVSEMARDHASIRASLAKAEERARCDTTAGA